MPWQIDRTRRDVDRRRRAAADNRRRAGSLNVLLLSDDRHVTTHLAYAAATPPLVDRPKSGASTIHFQSHGLHAAVNRAARFDAATPVGWESATPPGPCDTYARPPPARPDLRFSQPEHALRPLEFQGREGHS